MVFVTKPKTVRRIYKSVILKRGKHFYIQKFFLSYKFYTVVPSVFHTGAQLIKVLK